MLLYRYDNEKDVEESPNATQKKLLDISHDAKDSAENLTSALADLINHWIAAFNSHNVEEIVSLYSEKAELFDSGMRHPRSGRDAIHAWFTQRFRHMPTIRYTPLQSFLHDQEGTIHWLAEGQTPPLLGQRWLIRPFQVDGISLFRTQQNLIIWQHGYYDHLQIAQKVLPVLKWLPLKL